MCRLRSLFSHPIRATRRSDHADSDLSLRDAWMRCSGTRRARRRCMMPPMPRVPPFDRPATYDDLVKLPDHLVAEIRRWRAARLAAACGAACSRRIGARPEGGRAVRRWHRRPGQAGGSWTSRNFTSTRTSWCPIWPDGVERACPGARDSAFFSRRSRLGLRDSVAIHRVAGSRAEARRLCPRACRPCVADRPSGAHAGEYRASRTVTGRFWRRMPAPKSCAPIRSARSSWISRPCGQTEAVPRLA